MRFLTDLKYFLAIRKKGDLLFSGVKRLFKNMFLNFFLNLHQNNIFVIFLVDAALQQQVGKVIEAGI